MELRQLEALEAVIEAGSFTAAARRRHLSQPALWAQVRALEEELGVTLFARQGRGVVPTASCLALRARVRAVLDGVDALATLSREVAGGRAAPARIGCARFHVPFFLADAIARCRKAHPDAPLPHILPVSSETATPRLLAGDLDLVVQPKTASSGLCSHILYPVWGCAVGPLVRGPRLDVRALNEAPIATFPAGFLLRTTIEDAARAQRVSLNVIHEDRDAAPLLAMARRGLWTAIVMNEALPRDHRYRVAKLADRKRVFSVDLALMWRSEESLSPAARDLRDAMIAEARAREKTRRGG